MTERIVGVLDTGLPRSFRNDPRVIYSDFGALDIGHGEKVFQSILSSCSSRALKIEWAGTNLSSLFKVEEALKYLSEKNLSVLNLSWAASSLPDSILSILHSMDRSGTLILCAYSKNLTLPWTEFFPVGIPGGLEVPEKIPGLPFTGTSFSCACLFGWISSLPSKLSKEEILERLKNWNPKEIEFNPSLSLEQKQKNLDI